MEPTTGLDFTALLAAISSTAIVTALTAAAAIKVGPNVARWGYNKVITWFKG